MPQGCLRERAQAWSMHTNCFQEKQDYLHEQRLRSTDQEGTHTHTVLRREGKRKDNIKGPKGQRHNLKGSSLSFCKERKSRKKQRG